MELSHHRTIKIVALLVLLTALIQPVYTALFLHAPEIPRKSLWGVEAFIFVLLTAFAGSALVMAKRYTLGFSAIAFSAVLNVIQVGIGLTQFGPAGEVAQLNADLAGVRTAVVTFSFFGYNAAKMLLGMAAVVFGMAILGRTDKGLAKVIGGAAVLTGIVAFVANALVMMFGIQGFFVPRALAGGSGVVATFFLALCLLSLNKDETA